MILAGVSLSFVFNGGILDKSQQAVNEYQNAANNESDILQYINSTLEQKINEINSGSGGTGNIPTVDSNGLADKDTTIVAKDDPNVQIVIPKGFAPVILMTDRTDSMPREDGTVKEIMPVEEWNNITKEDINKGIVVVDNAITYTESVPDFNEYVWIPIPDSSKFVRKAFTTPSKGEQVLSEETSNGAYYEDKTAQEYRDMVYSVGINKGFYISRYEASEMNSTTAQSKRGQNPWVDIPQTEAKTVSANMKAEINSHLIYGIEWDSILQWLLDSKAIISTSDSETDTINLDYIQNDSSSWGNYGKIRPGETFWPPGEEVALTATSEYWKVNNIYDLAGNAEELTQEERLGMSTGIALNAVSRGGNLYNEGDSSPVAERTFSVETSGSINYFGFRVAFYV